MKLLNNLILGASVLAMGLTPFSVAEASSQTSAYVERIDFARAGGINIDIVLKNTAANKHVNAVDIKTEKNTLDLELQGTVKCTKDKDIYYDKARVYFGPAGLFADDINAPAALYNNSYDPTAITWNGGFNGKWITEAGNDQPFSIPLAQIKNGNPALRLDPVEELNKKLQQHLNQGKSKVSFYQQDQFIEVERPLTLAGWCKKSVSKAGYKTISANIRIKYEGDPAVNETPVVKAQMQGQMPAQVGNNLPLKLDKADFQPNIPHYSGKCIPDSNQKIQVNLQFSGNGAGYLDLKVIPVSNTYADYGTYYTHSNIPVNAQASKKIDFSFPLKTMLEQNKYSYMAIPDGKTWNHNMKIQARYKPKDGGAWSDWKDYDTAVFKHSCQPQLNPQIGNTMGGGKVGGFQNGGQNNNTPQFQINKGKIDPNPVINKIEPNTRN